MDPIMNSLLSSFRRVPTAAVPVMLDCILTSAGFSPSSLFTSLLTEFPNIAKEIMEGNNGMDSEQHCCVGSYVAALCHLLKKSGANNAEMKLFIWRILIPLLKSAHLSHQELFNEVASMFFDAVLEMNSWEAVEATLVPFLFRLVVVSMGLIQSEETALFAWSSFTILQVSDGHLTQLHSFEQCNGMAINDMDRDLIPSQFDYFPLPVSCYILTLTLDASLKCTRVIDCTTGLQIFTKNLLWDLCNLTFLMLVQSVEHRTLAISLFLPSILKVFSSNYYFKVSIHGQNYAFSRKHLGEKIWTCCKTLFSLGLSERRDAYTVLSLYLSSGSFSNRIEDGCMFGTEETFDLTSVKEFWDEIKKGLVDEESLTRKQSLHVLKSILNLRDENCHYPGLSDAVSDRKSLVSCSMTKRERWASEEAKSLGVGKLHNFSEDSFNSWHRWETFIFLYEMLDEYGTHLVEAAWNHQMNLLLHSAFALENSENFVFGEQRGNSMQTQEEIYAWLTVLWERGFCHDNPQVRCLIMQSFLGIPWKDCESYARLLPQEFILRPFMEALNDPVHHKDFGLKEVYSSCTIDAAASFLFQYCSYLDERKQIKFLSDLASVAKRHSFGRPGLMCLAECIASAALGIKQHKSSEIACYNNACIEMVQWKNDKADLLDFLRFIIESSKQHFNPNYRFQVCERILDAATSVMTAVDLPLEMLLLFISCLPRELTDLGGPLRFKVQKWLSMSDEKLFTSSCHNPNLELLTTLYSFPRNFVYSHRLEARITFDDADIDTWEYEAKRWARVIFLASVHEQQLDTLFAFIHDHGTNLCKEYNLLEWMPVKFLILVASFVQELQIIQDRAAEGSIRDRVKADLHLPWMSGCVDLARKSGIFEKLAKLLCPILEELLLFAKSTSSIFWSSQLEQECNLPTSVTGRLGGPSQRRLSSDVTTSVLQAITSLKSLASISRWCAQFTAEESLNSAISFLWNFCWKTITTPSGGSEREAEICLGAYEALAHILKGLVTVFSPLTFDLVMENEISPLLEAGVKPTLDIFIQTLLQSINSLIAMGNLVRTRRAILINWKWFCLEYLLSFPKHVLGRYDQGSSSYFLSDVSLRWIFNDLVDSLENAGEASALPILRSVRLIMELFASKMTRLVITSCGGLTVQMMWNLVKSSWILHVSFNKRRVAPIAALLSSVLHKSVFSIEGMHESDDESGPLKWFTEKILEEGTKSPRTVRLAALHLSGLWLENPSTIKYYLKELKFLTMYGSVAFDEDFEAELAENLDAKSELSSLAQSPDSELTEVFINTELYARVSVAVLFYKLADMADMVGSTNEHRNSIEALASGKMFLLELLQSALVDKDLSKELYKKHSAIHRRKIRVWQMICILSRFVCKDIVEEVTCSLHTALQRNNLPSVRQYMETFGIYIYLKFPSLVGQQLVPLLQNYGIRPQALSSYVFIAANVILHAGKENQSKHLDELFPPIIPLLTSHHHTLRGFTQLLVYQILQKLYVPMDDSGSCVSMSLEKRCLGDLKSYLTENPDCARLRASMEGYLDAFDPKTSVTPAGIFINRVEEQFECVPKTLMDQVTIFLNDTRDDLRCSMARDAAIIKNEGLLSHENTNTSEISANSSQNYSSINQQDVLLDFQKKFTLAKHETHRATDFSIEDSKSFKSLADIEKEDQLLNQLLHSRNIAMQRLKESRQHLIIVASLVDRIPNLAGLARTCEVFRAAGLAMADKNILNDKQFQLISVTAEKWVPIVEVPVSSMRSFLEKKKREGFAILGLEQTANSKPLDQYAFPTRTVLVLGREKEGIPVEIIHILDACIEIPQLGVVRSLNVHVSGAIAIWEYTRQQRSLS